MAVSKTTVRDEVRLLIREYALDRYDLDILVFMARHPNARFSGLVISHALGSGKSYTDQALCRLAERGILSAEMKNGVTLYSLGDQLLRTVWLSMLTFDYNERLRMLSGASCAPETLP